MLQIPAYCPLTSGVNKDGRKISGLAYTCQRITDSKFLDAKNSAWVDQPVLNSLKERGRDIKGNADPRSGMLRGSYVPTEAPAFANNSDTIGQFMVIYHDKAKDNLIVDSILFHNGFKIEGKLLAQPSAQSMSGRIGI